MRKGLLIYLLVLTTPFVLLFGQQSKPKLVLLIVVDQMRADYLDRFDDLYSDGGFKRLSSHGAVMKNCNFLHSMTNTGPGHSTLFSGIPLRVSGIVSNAWYSVPLGRSVYCVEDGSVSGVGVDTSEVNGKMSPRNFNGTSLCDELLKASPSSRAVGIAIKDRGAILPAGKHPTGAYWFDAGSGNWITSTYYMKSLPAWVAAFNARHLPEQSLGTSWEKMLPEKDYVRAGIDDQPGEGSIPGETRRTFPHRISDLATPGFKNRFRRFDAFATSPFGNVMTAEFAKAAIEGEQLGQRGVTDILTVSFSSPDYCGHIFGPDSHEIEDMYVRLDGVLEDFLKFLDAKVGLSNIDIALTGDHGIPPIPEKIPQTGARRINGGDLLNLLKVRMGQRYNYDEGNDRLIPALSNDQIYVDHTAIAAKGFIEQEFIEAIAELLRGQKYVAHAFTRSEIERAACVGTTDPILSSVVQTFDGRRCGDIAIILTPYSYFSSLTTGVNHGTPYEYDTHVPLVLVGPKIKAGVYADSCAPNDIAPTFAAILGIHAPEYTIGKPLDELLEAEPSK